MYKRSWGVLTLLIASILFLGVTLYGDSQRVLAAGTPTPAPSSTERIFFISTSNDTFGDFFIINADGTGIKRITQSFVIDAANNLIKTEHVAYDSSYMTKGWLWGGAMVTPDGHYVAVAWMVTIFDSSKKDGVAVTKPGLYLVDGDTLKVTTIPVESMKRFSTIDISPDGKLLAFVAERNGKGQIDVVDLQNNFKIQPLIDDDTDKDFPAWSPDGKSLLYVGAKDGKSQVYLANGDGSNPRSLTDNLKIDTVPTKPSDFSIYRPHLPEEKMEPNWSPDGKHIAFASWQGRQVASYLMDADGSNIRQVQPSGKGGNIFWFDDQTLLFGSNRAVRSNFQLFTMKADGTGERRMTDHGGGLFNLDISADNKRLLFDTGLDRIYLMNADGTDEHILRFGAGYGVFWEPWDQTH